MEANDKENNAKTSTAEALMSLRVPTQTCNTTLVGGQTTSNTQEEPRLWVKGGKPCDEPGGEKFLAAARFFSPRRDFFRRSERREMNLASAKFFSMR